MDELSERVKAGRGDIDLNLLLKSSSAGEKPEYLIEPAYEYIPAEDTIHYVFHNKNKGVKISDGVEINKLNPARGWTIVVIISRGIYVLVGGASSDNSDVELEIPHDEIKKLEGCTGISKNKLIIETSDSEYYIPIQPDDNVMEAISYIKEVKRKQEQDDENNQVWSIDNLYSVSPMKFEAVLAHLWEEKGYDIKTTQSSGDKGVDIIAQSAEEKILIQAKRYKPNSNMVGIQTVQRVAGLLPDSELNPTSVIVATTSGFTTQANDRAKKIDEISLLDGEAVVKLLNDSKLKPKKFDITSSSGQKNQQHQTEESNFETIEVKAGAQKRHPFENIVNSEQSVAKSKYFGEYCPACENFNSIWKTKNANSSRERYKCESCNTTWRWERDPDSGWKAVGGPRDGEKKKVYKWRDN